MTASEITKTALKELTARGAFVWRQNQVRVPGRAFTGMKGLADIIGFNKRTGLFVMCEIKTETDRLSQDQITLLTQAKIAGCVVLIATCEKGKFIIKEYLND